MAIQKCEVNMQIAYYDVEKNEMCLRDATAEEQVAILSASSDNTFDSKNSDLLMQLEDIDKRSIRALREGNTARIQELETQAATLRLQLIK
jgi:hypothetical protein